MAAKVILSAERSSGKFSDRVLLLGEGEQVGVGRSTRELRPDTQNAVFDSRVLSKHQATLIFHRGEFLLRDSGSSNGSFINNFRRLLPSHRLHYPTFQAEQAGRAESRDENLLQGHPEVWVSGQRQEQESQGEVRGGEGAALPSFW